MTSHYGQAFIRIVFTPLPQRVLRGGFLGTSFQSRDRVPFIYGILINTDVGNPVMLVGIFSRSMASPKTVTGRALGIQPLIKRPRPYSFLSISNDFALRLVFQHPRLQISGASDLRQCLVPTFEADGCPLPLRRRTC